MNSKKFLLSTLSLCVLISPFTSCNQEGNNANEEVVLKSRQTSKVQRYKENFASIKAIFDEGVTEQNLGTLLSLMGEDPKAITLNEFNQIYSKTLATDVSDMTVKDLLAMPFYQQKTSEFRKAIEGIFAGEDLSSYFDSVDYKKLSQEDKELLEGMYSVRTELEKQNITTAYFHNDYPGGGYSHPVSDSTGAILLHIGIAAGIGFVIGGPAGALIGGGIGFLTGVISARLKK